MTAGAAPAGPPAEARPIDLALARVHLRTGSLGLARAELEALAGRGVLDRDGLVDLAEARWRTGDLPGAGDAASAYLAADGDALVGLVIAAEATVAAGRPGEARSIVGRALESSEGPVDIEFAGMPRSSIWPADRAAEPAAPGTGGMPAADAHAAAAPVAPPIDPSRELERGRAALESGLAEVAALHLLLALRGGPALAPAVLALLSRSPAAVGPAIEIVRGDAHRLVGQEAAAAAAWTGAARAIEDAERARARTRPG